MSLAGKGLCVNDHCGNGGARKEERERERDKMAIREREREKQKQTKDYDDDYYCDLVRVIALVTLSLSLSPHLFPGNNVSSDSRSQLVFHLKENFSVSFYVTCLQRRLAGHRLTYKY